MGRVWAVSVATLAMSNSGVHPSLSRYLQLRMFAVDGSPVRGIIFCASTSARGNGGEESRLSRRFYCEGRAKNRSLVPSCLARSGPSSEQVAICSERTILREVNFPGFVQAPAAAGKEKGQNMQTRTVILAVAAILLTVPIAANADFVNVALNKPVSASSVYDPSYGEASNAVDGDFNTMWGSSAHGTPADPQWLVVDMGQDYSIDRITLTLASGIPGYTNIYNVYGKASLATDWSLIGSGTLTDTYDPEDQWLTNGVSMRYLKHEVIGGTHWAHLLELQAFASQVPEPHPGDANNDGAVNVVDLGVLAKYYDTATGATWEMADFSGDGAVNVVDLGVLAKNYDWVGAPAGAAPEPATLSLLALGGLAMLRRRK